MARSGFRAGRYGILVALLFAWVIGIDVRSGFADVTAVKGSALGAFADDIRLFNAAQPDFGPAPTVALPAGGSAGPVTDAEPTTLVQYGPAILFSSGAVNVSTQGAPGPAGTVTSSANIANANTSRQEVFTASNVASTCTASEGAAPTGSTVITGGRLVTSEGNPDVEGDETIVDVPANPPPNTEYTGVIESVGDSFRYVFNEQTTAADGTITVTAAHMILLGPTATGHLYLGQVTCDVTAGPAGPTTTASTGPSTTATTGPSTTATTGPTTSAPTATTAASTTAAATGTVSGGAYGFFTDVALFGAPRATRGPDPTVTLPATGSATPITDSSPSGEARYGPAILFSSGCCSMEVTTQGTPGGTVSSSAKVTNVNASGQEVLTAANISSSCTASRTAGTAGTTTITGGRLMTSEGNPDVEGDETFVQVPANPSPNQTFEGRIEGVGDTFRYVFNEQVVRDGSITVNAAHQYLLGPTATGELIIGQSRCGTSAAGGGGVGGAGNNSGVIGRLARTGNQPVWVVSVGLALLGSGLLVFLLGRRRFLGRRG